MKAMMLAIAGLAALCAAPACAQYGGPYGGYGSGYEGGRGGYEGGRGGYGRSYGRRDFDDDDDEGPRYRRRLDSYGPGRSYERRSAAGSICVTARGNCQLVGLVAAELPLLL